jgi:hypothetical protein
VLVLSRAGFCFHDSASFPSVLHSVLPLPRRYIFNILPFLLLSFR